MSAKTKEIRKILLGQAAMENGSIVAAKSAAQLLFNGTYNGSASVAVGGVECAMIQYRIDSDLESAFEECLRVFSRMGSNVELESAPNAVACLHQPVWNNPVVATMETEGRELLLCLYSAKTALKNVSMNSIANRWRKEMPESLREVDVTMTPQSLGDEESMNRFEKWKERKAEKKAEKKSGKKDHTDKLFDKWKKMGL